MTEVRLTAVTELIGAESTDDGQHIAVGFIDRAGDRHQFAVPRRRAIELMGFLTKAIKTAIERSGKSQQPSLAIVMESAEIGGSHSQKLVSMSLQIAPGSILEFALTPDQATNLSEALATAAALLSRPRPSETH